MNVNVFIQFQAVNPRSQRDAMNIKSLLCATLLAAITLAPCGATFAKAQTANAPLGTTAMQPAGGDMETGWWSSLPKEDKMLYTNISAATFIALYGLADWDYGTGGWNEADEGWFESDSKYGGADKLGHVWGTYVFADALTGLYKSFGYDSQTANNYGALSAWAVQAFMELGDATSETQGFSYEDMIANTVGALASVLMERYPELDRKIDFRLEYVFNVDINGIFDDYSNQFYSLVLKLDGFDAFQDNYLKYLEFHGGYYSRGYDSTEVDRERAFYAGISFNFSHLFHAYGHHKTGKTLEYLQVPYTVLKAKNNMDD